MYLSIIVPLYNESAIIPELYKRLSEVARSIHEQYEIIFINDGSRDDTYTQIKALAANDPNIKFIHFSRNFGHQIAVSAGIDRCTGQAVVIIDGDLQDPPEVIPELHTKYLQGFKVVYAKRRSRQGESWFKKLTAKAFYRILARLTSVNIPLDTGDFRLMDRELVKYLRQMPEKNKFLRGQIAWLGFNQTFVEFDRQERKAGQTGYPFSKMLRFALDGITAFSDKPLKIATVLGFWVFFIAIGLMVYAFISHFAMGKTMPGWTSLMVSVAFLGAIQLFSLGVIGEYISRINTNVRNRPLYVIEDANIPPDPA